MSQNIARTKLLKAGAMIRPARLIGLLAWAFFLALVPSNERAYAADSSDRPNVLFIAVDDLNDWVGCLGGHPQAKTPNIDKLARKGVLFEQAHCAAPLCSPSRTSIMTGLRPSTTGIYGNLNWFRDMPEYKDWVTLPQYFRQHGYVAWGGGKLYHQAHGKFSDAAAWDHVYSTRTGAVPPPQSERYKHGLRPKFESNPILARLIDWGPTDHPIEANPDWKTAEGAAQFLGRDHEKPFFLGCGIYLPHLPWYAPKKFFDMHPLEDIVLPPYKADDFDDIPAIGHRMGERHIKHIRESGKWKEAVQGCLAADSFADACVGHVLAALEKSRYRDNTIVVLWGDHGYDVGEKKIGKLALWEQTTRTPLIIYAPGKLPSGTPARGMICKSPVSLVDLYPTLLELCGLPKNKQLDGRSFAPLVNDPNADWPYPAIITNSPHWLGANHAVRSREFHYIHYSDGGEELYDVKADPLQRKNLADDPAHASAKAELKKWLPKKNAPHFGAPTKAGDNKPLKTKAADNSPAVSGVARFEGPRPKRQGLGMDKASLKLHKSPPLDENLLVGPDGALANVFVQVKKGVEDKEYPVPAKPAVVDQVGSIFRPRVQGVMVGQKLVLRNSDPYIHNVRSLSFRNRAFNIAQPPKTADREQVFRRKESAPVLLGCDFHRWMRAYVFVMDHPYFATTDAQGRFRIEGLSAGEYTLEAWHEEFGKQQAQITVGSDGAAEADFTFQAKEQ